MPVALEEVRVLLFEAISTCKTGQLIEGRTKKNLEEL